LVLSLILELEANMSDATERIRQLATPSRLNLGWQLSSELAWPSDPAANPWRVSTYAMTRPRQFPQVIWDHAAPLSAIPVRDLVELNDYFDRGDMPEVEADVNHLLGCLWPEPAWDEEVADWLAECETGRGIGHRFDAFI
jgi:hypothetical protein